MFEDGTEARFWGTNLTAGALFGTMLREDIAIQARRLSQLGFNLVRLHNHDSPWVDPNIFGKGKSRDTTTLSEDALATLDIPVIEVHISNVYKRESFRHHSTVSSVATGVICGLGTIGYELALEAVKSKL